MTSVCITIEDFTWNRISYDDEAEGSQGDKLHNHAFINTPTCVRTCSITLNRSSLKLYLHWTLSRDVKFYFSFTRRDSNAAEWN